MPSATPTPANLFLRTFARVSPFFVLLSFFQFSALLALASPATPTATVKRQAQAQFERAEQQRAALNIKSRSRRTLADYRQVVASYRRVYLITPRAAEVPDALLAIAQLYTEMGERFGRTYYQSAVDAYRFLLREYPSSRYVPDSMLVCAKLQRDQLADLFRRGENLSGLPEALPAFSTKARSPGRRSRIGPPPEQRKPFVKLIRSSAKKESAEAPLLGMLMRNDQLSPRRSRRRLSNFALSFSLVCRHPPFAPHSQRLNRGHHPRHH